MKIGSYPYTEVKRHDTVRDILLDTGVDCPDYPIIRYKEGKDVVAVDWKDFRNDLEYIGAYFLSEGISKDHIAIVGQNSYKVTLMMHSIIASGNVYIPLDNELPAASLMDLVRDSDATVLLYSDKYKFLYDEIVKTNHRIKKFINLDTELNEIMRIGKELTESGNRAFMELKVEQDDLAAIIFTSGTTGVAKGVMLSQNNLAATAVADAMAYGFEGSILAFLPYHHAFQIVTSLAVLLLKREFIMGNGARTLVSELKEYNPGMVTFVPVIVEAFYKQILAGIKAKGMEEQFQKAREESKKLYDAGTDRRKEFFGEITAAMFGKNLYMGVIGGAHSDPQYISFFRELGIDICDSYGITECSPTVTTARRYDYRDGSVGKAIPICEMKILDPGEDGIGEICIKGDNTMLGYYKNQAATDAAFIDGWYKSGDLGWIDDDGYLYITGRIKNVIVLSNGKNVFPEELELLLRRCSLINEVVVQERDDQIIAEVFPNDKPEATEEDKQNTKNVILEFVEKYNKEMPFYKNIQQTVFRDMEFPKTSIRKIKRDYSKKVKK